VISGAVQLFTEEMLLAWVKAAIARTGIRDIVCGGGVFMNVKANMLLAQLPEVNSIYVMPSAADESLSIGAALYRAYQRSQSMDRSASVLQHLYLGGDTSPEAERRALAAAKARDDLEITEPADIDAEIARFIADGEIVARCRGPMEWGARALGNRSILASANDYRLVDRINRIVKQRDFWMPFAPSILAEQADRYVEDPKGLSPPFMTFALPSRPETYEEITAGSHPRDRTVRAQIVSQNANPGYHRLIGRFAALTGRGAVLNTSFNLHGYPIAYTTDDALDVLRNSELDRLALNHHLVRKRGREARAA